MAHLLCLGKEVRCWYGMSHSRIPWCLHTAVFPVEKQVLWQRRQREERSNILIRHLETIAVEMLGVFGPEAHQFIKDLGRRIEDTTLEPLSTYDLKQRIVQRGN